MHAKTELLALIIIITSIASNSHATESNPKVLLGMNFQFTPAVDKEKETELLGLDVDAGRFFSGSNRLAWLLNIGVQEQDILSDSVKRYTAGLSYNYFFRTQTGEESIRPFIGVKRTYYFGRGSREEALDCINCSDVEEDYSGGNFFAVLGIRTGTNLVLKAEYRLSDKGSKYSKSAYDPYGVGPEYDYGLNNIPDPMIILSIGYWGRSR